MKDLSSIRIQCNGVFDLRNVTDENGNKEAITAKNTIIATGSDSTSFPGLEFDEKIVVSSTG